MNARELIEKVNEDNFLKQAMSFYNGNEKVALYSLGRLPIPSSLENKAINTISNDIKLKELDKKYMELNREWRKTNTGILGTSSEMGKLSNERATRYTFLYDSFMFANHPDLKTADDKTKKLFFNR